MNVRLGIADEDPVWAFAGNWLDDGFHVDPRHNLTGRHQVLLRWFDAGLIKCYAYPGHTAVGEIVQGNEPSWLAGATQRGPFLERAPSDARSLINDVGRSRDPIVTGDTSSRR